MSVFQELGVFWMGFIFLSDIRRFFGSEKLGQPETVLFSVVWLSVLKNKSVSSRKFSVGSGRLLLWGEPGDSWLEPAPGSKGTGGAAVAWAEMPLQPVEKPLVELLFLPSWGEGACYCSYPHCSLWRTLQWRYFLLETWRWVDSRTGFPDRNFSLRRSHAGAACEGQ